MKMGKMGNFIRSINKRSLKYGSLSIVLIAAAVAVAIIVNLLVTAIQDRGIINMKFDLTSSGLYSIGDTTKEILQQLDKDVEIYGLFDIGEINSNVSLKQIKEVLSQYEKYGHVQVKYLDPDKEPGLINEIDPTGLKDIEKGDFVVKCGSKVRKLLANEIYQTEYDYQTGQATGASFIGEQGFTGAIKYVASDKTPVVYFTQGHEEGQVESNYTLLKTQLESNNYEVKSINLMTEENVPDDAEILIVASPKVDISVQEKDKLKDYLKNGGKAVFLFDSLESNPKFTQFEDLLAEYNVGLNYDKVKETDQQRYYPGDPSAVVLDVPSSNVIQREYQLLLAGSRSIKILKNQKDYITVTSLMKTSDKAVGEQIDKSVGPDNQGPLDLGVAVEHNGGAKQAKLLVMGNGLFISDAARQQYGQYFDYGNNFFTMSLSWMMDKTDEVVIEAKSLNTESLNMTSAAQANTVALLTVIVFPLLILGFGTFVWIRRRHL